jgi:hypothetical protein
MMQKRLSGEPTPVTYAAQPSAEHMAADAEIAAFPIPVEAEDNTIIGINDVFESGPPVR